MNALDWIILAIIMFSALVAAAQGFIFEIISLAGALAGYLLAAWGCVKLAPWFLPYVKTQAFADLAGFLAIFFGVILFAGAMARILRWMVHEAGFRWVDRSLGAAFGFVRGAVIVTAGLLAITAFAPEAPELAGSQLASYFVVAGRGASWLAPSDIRQKFREGVDKLRQGPGSGATVKQQNK
ncbi:MAG TPA: CvpA family protein [Candidatus Angelobacter sp.]|nr:CvpA family protein [Candidatus Angelobacter sp.]